MISKRYRALPKDTKRLPQDTIQNLIKIVKKNCTTKFNESIDLSFKMNLKQKKNEINLRTLVNLPAGSGKNIKVGVICDEESFAEAKKSGADIYGSEDVITEISSGKIKFDKLIATPTMMIKLSKVAKILGPKGLMPNPKLGTVTKEIGKAVKSAKTGQVEIKNDKDGNVSLSIGKKSFSDENLIKNFKAVIEAISKEKSSKIKGNLIKNAFLTSTMGVSYKLKLEKNI